MNTSCSVLNWTVTDVVVWAKRENVDASIIKCIECEKLNGKSILILSEYDLHELRKNCANCNLKLGDVKVFWLLIRNLQRTNHDSLTCLGFSSSENVHHHMLLHTAPGFHLHSHPTSDILHYNDFDRISPPISIDGRATSIQPEFFKTTISCGYAFLVTWITAFVMVVVHERVPDMKRYPPLPDIFLDNVPHIPWAFHMCELTGTILFSIWACVTIVHKHRMVLIRRFFALSGTVFLLRCFTMLITSLSVPGTHLQCTANDYAIDDEGLDWIDALILRITRAYTIWSGLGMSIQGVRTCGDYMFSGHTVALTILNFFITEYTPRRLYFLHTITWLLNMFGIFFILAAHEHYSIDVFVAFYITSRLFLYYHTLSNNQALMSRDSTRTRIWFPMFCYFESSVDGIIPNEYDTIDEICCQIFNWILHLKDMCMLTARRIWVLQEEALSNSKLASKRVSQKNLLPSSSSSSLNNSDNATNHSSIITKQNLPDASNLESNEAIEKQKDGEAVPLKSGIETDIIFPKKDL